VLVGSRGVVSDFREKVDAKEEASAVNMDQLEFGEVICHDVIHDGTIMGSLVR